MHVPNLRMVPGTKEHDGQAGIPEISNIKEFQIDIIMQIAYSVLVLLELCRVVQLKLSYASNYFYIEVPKILSGLIPQCLYLIKQ